MTILEAILQGLIQGFTEFLPVSSSGHLSVFQYLSGNSSEEAALFSLFLHAGTLIAVFVAFWKDIASLIVEVLLSIRDIFAGKLNVRHLNASQRMILLIFIGLLPLSSALFLSDYYTMVSSDNSILLEGLCFLITAVALFIADKTPNGRYTQLDTPLWVAFAVGVAQAIAPLPGISRSGSTLAIALLLGMRMNFAVTYSFLLGIPAILGAILLDFADVMALSESFDVVMMSVAFMTAAISGLCSIFLIKLIAQNKKLKIFSAYLVVFGGFVLFTAFYDPANGYPIRNFFTNLIGG